VRRGTLFVLVAIVAVAVAGACTRTRTLDASELNQRIATDMQAKKLADEGVVVSCPDDVPAEAGRTFDCTGTNPDGTTLTIQVTQTDDQGHVTYKVVGAG
jgi:archaellum component FlaG (FlaF/FlaG flagellin family)